VKALYNSISIGDSDVGYISAGLFYRILTVTLPWDDPSNNKLGQAEYYEPLDCGGFVNSHKTTFVKRMYCTPNVSTEYRNIYSRSFDE